MEKDPKNQEKPTSAIDKYRNDALVVRSYKTTRNVVPPSDNRCKGKPSAESLRNLVFLLNNCDVPMTGMTTLTLGSDVSMAMSVAEHKQYLKAALTKLMRLKSVTQYCWVREFTKIGTPHWHVFHDMDFGDCSALDADGVDWCQSSTWSAWAANYIWKKIDRLPHLLKQIGYMSEGNGIDHTGCVRIEKLRSEAAGRYAGKEGAKRFQKEALHERWRLGGLWWKPSKNVKCTPVQRIQVRTSSLKQAKVNIGDREILVPYRLQFDRGFSVEQPVKPYEPPTWSEFDSFDDRGSTRMPGESG